MQERSGADPDAALLALLRSGDEQAYVGLVAAYSRPMLRIARRYARSHAVAEEAVQETWLAVIQTLDLFEGRSSFKTWVFRILVNQAQARAKREVRVLPLTDVLSQANDPNGAEERLMMASRQRWPDDWSAPVWSWAAQPEEAALAAETLGRLQKAVARLPERQRQVLTLRDMVGASADEVCKELGLQPSNQRVLLHRARIAVRAELSLHLT